MVKSFFVVESIPLLRFAVRKVIENLSELEVVGSFSDVNELFEIAHAKQPNWIWLDGTIPSVRSGEIPQKLKYFFPNTKLIIFGLGDSLSQIRRYYKQGARAYINKEESSEAIGSALTDILHDKQYVSPTLLDQAADWLTKSVLSHPKRTLNPLTAREIEVLKLITEECTSQEIADRLFVSRSTVETHRINLTQKLGVKNTAGLVRVAVEENLCSAFV